MNASDSALVVIDLQERLLAAQPGAARIVWNARRLLAGARALGVVPACTEQAPAKLGATVRELAALVPEPLAKSAMSAAACAGLLGTLRRGGVRNVVLVGVETHVCVAQTALDLAAEGFQPQVVADAVGSRFAHDHEVALRRLATLGVPVTTTEAVLFEWLADASHPAFREISSLAKEAGPTP